MSYELKAYPVGPISPKGWVIEPGEAKRDWMMQTPHQAALRCLPLLIAGQAGWVIRCPVGFKVTWNGKREPAGSLDFQFSEDSERFSGEIVSNFGYGIVTFKIPWLFRSSEGLGLMVRGPANTFLDNVVPLEGLVETDWAPYTFTMNWKIIRPKHAVWFKKGDPVCMIAPYPIGLLEEIEPSFESFDDNPELFDEFLQWRGHRQQQVREARQDGTSAGHFRLDYVKGRHPDGSVTREHRPSLKLREFKPGSTAAEPA